jgi:hypothetical protein
LDFKNLLEEENKSLIISYKTLRIYLGFLAFLLPIIIVTGSLLFGECKGIEDSISAYYYTVTGHVFIGILCAFTIFLLSYKGHQKIDTISSSLAGVFALGVAFFPVMYKGDEGNDCIVLTTISNNLIDAIHLISAALFFLILAFMSLYLFTKGKSNPTHEKKMRNKVYKVCGWIMLVSIILMAVYSIGLKNNESISGLKPIFFL